MDKIKCEVIRDLMPLVADEVASAESKEIVDGHMEGCETCKAYYAGMTAQLARTAVPEDGPTSTFVKFTHRMEKRVRMKKVFIALTAAIVALCVVIVGVGVVYDRMNTYDVMPIEQTKAWLWRENDGDVNLMIQMQDGFGWYDHMGLYREGDIFYLVPYEPELKLWNQGERGGWYEQFQLDLMWKNNQLYHSILSYETEYDVEKDEFIEKVKEYEVPLRLVRWGYPDNYTTLYEQGDMIPTYKELAVQIDGFEANDVEEGPEAAATPAVIATPVPSVQED